MKLLFSFALMLSGLPLAKAEGQPGKRGPQILKKIVSQPWAAGWKSATLEKVRLVSEKPDLAQPLKLPPVWCATIAGPDGKTGHLIWDSTGEGRLVEFALDDTLEVKGETARAIQGIPNLQQFPVELEAGKFAASGCVPTAAASVVSFWADRRYPQWRGEDGRTTAALALRFRKQLKMKLIPDLDGFTPNGMALAGAYPADLARVLQADVLAKKVPLKITLSRFRFADLKAEIEASRPVLVSCLVRVPQQPELSWGHELAAVGYCQIDEVKLVGVVDNFFPARHAETIRWIREDAFRSMLVLKPEPKPEK